MFATSRSARNSHGNVIILCSVTFALISLLLIIAYSFSGLYLVHNHLQTAANEIALTGAKKLNDNDRLGQMNNMVARCRQLVYSSQQEYEEAKSKSPNLAAFAEPLLKESRDSAMMLDSERKSLSNLAKREATDAMQEQFKSIKACYQVTLPWLRISNVRIQTPEFGKVSGMESNVEEMTLLGDLDKDDRAQGRVDISSTGSMGKGLDLYKADKDLVVPGEPSLQFKLSSLPPPVNGVISPARVLLARKFQQTQPSDDFAPSSVKVIIDIDVKTGLGPSASSDMEASGSSITTGASEQL